MVSVVNPTLTGTATSFNSASVCAFRLEEIQINSTPTGFNPRFHLKQHLRKWQVRKGRNRSNTIEALNIKRKFEYVSELEIYIEKPRRTFASDAIISGEKSRSSTVGNVRRVA